jgi:hypothetical protein
MRGSIDGVDELIEVQRNRRRSVHLDECLLGGKKEWTQFAHWSRRLISEPFAQSLERVNAARTQTVERRERRNRGAALRLDA